VHTISKKPISLCQDLPGKREPWQSFGPTSDRDRANKNEIEIFVFSVTSNDFPHDMLLPIFSLKIGALPSAVGVSAIVVDGTGYGLNRNGSTIDSRLCD
jgi:hypothetical protein